MKKLIAAAAAALFSAGLSFAPAHAATENYIINGDFLQGDLHWKSESDGAFNIKYGNNTAMISSTGAEYAYRLYQCVDLPNGIYDLTLKASVSDIDGIYYAYARTEGHTLASTSVPESTAMQSVTVPGIIVDDGKCYIGVYAKGSATVTLDDFVLKESTDTETRVPFLKGGEISKLTYVEDMGGKFYHADGTEGDALQIMAENGFNLARIRVLNDPGKGHGDGTYYLPEGYQTEEDCLELARRAKDKGMKIEFTFAYSDYWVDGDKQFIPHEWAEEIAEKNLTGTKKYEYLENKVYEYTKDIMQKLVAQGTCPEFVSIGNEMQCGMFFGDAKKDNYKGELYYDKPWLLRFVNAGARAVREVAPDTKIVIHTDNGGKVFDWLNANWDATAFQYLLKRADYDVMAVSYYPYYNGNISIDNIVTEFNKCINDLGKDVMIMESGYNFAEKRSDGYEGQLQDNGYYQNTYGETKDGQRAYLTEMYSKLKAVSGGRCIGVSYWDPVMLTDNVGWAISEDGDYKQGNVITNSTIFDFDGKALPGQLAMKYNTNSTDKLLLTGKSEPDTDIELTVNEETVKTRSDSFGDFIVSVDYPTDGKLRIIESKKSYTLDAPYDGVVLSLSPSNSISVANNTATAHYEWTADGDEAVFGVLAAYDESGNLADVKTVTFKNGAADLSLDLTEKAVFRSYLWRVEDMKPVADPVRFEIGK